MKALLQRVTSAQVYVDGSVISSIGPGLLVFLAVIKDDTQEDADWLARKILSHRMFADEERPMNRSVLDIEGDVLIVPQFTLAAETARGNRPDFSRAEQPDRAEQMFEYFVDQIKKQVPTVGLGIFGTNMEVSLVNDGPVTILLTRDPQT